MTFWYKNNPQDHIWWREDTEKIGEFVFSFDKENVYYLYRDYNLMTNEERKIFDRENPQWRKFFKGGE